ncbi:DASH complex, subunit Spc19 [Akanthomyces lecanii RCEF 1005]|uniref:DASH complex subunit SPC19 n=1 Tax=Akanthomyces lecanii RCEF 1005 TaxID=1081108 RepID=A0A162IT77_CORDF|nr:DASH complex, subunit Spc19 [Akanthomyces lecanii RCEF 1005]
MASSASYADCVSSLRTSLKFLESSVETLDEGVSDFPRLNNVLKSVRHYELVPQPKLAAAEASLRDEIGPYIAFLLSRADAQTERQERRIETLKARCDLQQGRMAKPEAGSAAAARQKSRLLSSEDKLRARAIRQRKEALRYGVERLELEVLQKERELRRRLDG